MNRLDDFLNSITMYRVVLYGLTIIAFVAIVYGFLGISGYNGIELLISLLFILGVCLVTNFIISKIIGAVTNVESVYITSFILFLIFPPASDYSGYTTIFLTSVIAMASKYVLAIGKKHLFNPVAIGVLTISLLGIGGATWWVGSFLMTPTVLIIGFLIVKKIRRFNLLFAFLISTTITIIFTGYSIQSNLLILISEIFTSWPIWFFGTIMLTEPLTTPPTRNFQIYYGVLVGILFGSQFHFGSLYSTPEFALLIGNLFSYLVSPKQKLFLKLKEKLEIAKDTYEFIFNPDKFFNYNPGQYVEWTLGHSHPDNRGNRRYFTLASSPTEKDIRLGVRYSPESSSFKNKLKDMEVGDQIIATQLSGDFLLPEDQTRKLVFIAGGIGVTPFRSMIKYLLDKDEKRDIFFFYANKLEQDIAYKELFEEARLKLGIKVIYVLSEEESVPQGWEGKAGRINEEMLKTEVPDYKARTFYLSGPQSMVTAYKDMLLKLGISRSNIVTDYFPGY